VSRRDGLSSPADDATQDADSTSYWDRYSDRILGGSVLLVLLVGTLAYSVIEDWSLVDSFYFSSVALTVVGFGDLEPSTDFSKIFTVFYIFSGVAIVGTWLSMRLKRRGRKMAQRHHSNIGHTPDAQPDPPAPPASEG
jgi:hypothetical protein